MKSNDRTTKSDAHCALAWSSPIQITNLVIKTFGYALPHWGLIIYENSCYAIEMSRDKCYLFSSSTKTAWFSRIDMRRVLGKCLFIQFAVLLLFQCAVSEFWAQFLELLIVTSFNCSLCLVHAAAVIVSFLSLLNLFIYNARSSNQRNVIFHTVVNTFCRVQLRSAEKVYFSSKSLIQQSQLRFKCSSFYSEFHSIRSASELKQHFA